MLRVSVFICLPVSICVFCLTVSKYLLAVEPPFSLIFVNLRKFLKVSTGGAETWSFHHITGQASSRATCIMIPFKGKKTQRI